MTETNLDRLLDDLLAQTLAPVPGAGDLAFVSKIESRVAELERYRRWRMMMVHRFTTQLLSVAAVGGAIALISRIPDRAVAIGPESAFIWPGLLIMLLCWLVLTGIRPRLIN